MTELVVTSTNNTVVVSGELDADTADCLSAAIEAAGADVRVVLSECTFIDSSGLFDICGVADTLTIDDLAAAA